VSGDRPIAVDTSFIVALLKGSVRTERRLNQIAFPVCVAGELRFGARSGKNAERKLTEVNDLISRGAILPIDDGTAHVYAEVRQPLKTAGAPLPENDVWIAATCIQHELELLTLDRHFDFVDRLRLAQA